MTRLTALNLSCAVGALVLTLPGAVHAQVQPQSTTDDDQSTPDGERQDQTETPTQPGDRDGRAVIEERGITVTGTRFADVLSQPQSKSIIDAEDRNLAGIGNIRTVIDTQPGINYTAEFGLNVRGIGRQTGQSVLGQENTVVQYVDGFINLVPTNIAESTLFGGNIQFLRGPSGTTYGRNGIAGAVNLLSRAPTPTYTGEVEAGFGRAGYTDIGANVAGPITDNLGFRVGLQRFDIPSIQKNLGRALDTSDRAGFAQDNLYVEFQLAWRLRNFHIRNRFTHFEYDNQPGYPTLTAYNVGTPATATAAATGVFGGLSPNPQFQYSGPVPSQPYQINVDFAGYDRLRNNLQDIVNADLDLGFGTLYYVGGYQQFVSSGMSDRDLTSRASYNPFTPGANGIPIAPVFAPGTIVPTDYRTQYRNDDYHWSQELRFEGKRGGQLDYVLGFYYFNQHADESFAQTIPGATAVLTTPQTSVTDPTPGAPNPDRAEFAQRNIYDIRSTAVFGNFTYDLTPELRFDGGLRYTWDEKEATNTFRYVFYYPPLFAADVSPAVSSANPFRRDQGLSGRAAIAYRPTPGSQIYLSYQRGYQSSAFTLGQGLAPNNIADKEHLDVYEVGGNATVGRFRFDGSAFYQNFFGQQIPITSLQAGAPLPNGQLPLIPFQRFTNAALSRVYGAEAQLTWRPASERSNIVASYTYLHPTFRNFCPTSVGQPVCGAVDVAELPAAAGAPPNPLAGLPQNLSGNEIPRTPRHKASLYGYYGIDLGGAGWLYPGGSIAYQSSFRTAPFDADRYRVDGRTIVGVTLTYRSPGDHLDVTGSVLNVFRTRYTDNGSVSLVGNVLNQTTTYGQDQYWTVTARYRF